MIIGITGGKGGTGKSTVATALAYELSRTDKVLIVDMDADCPNDHLILGIDRKKHEEVFSRIPRFDSCKKCGICQTACRYNALISVKGRKPILMEQQCNGCGACYYRCPNESIVWDKKPVGTIYSGSVQNMDLLSGELKINEPISEIIVNHLNRLIEKRKDAYDHIIVDTSAGTKCDVISALQGVNLALAVTEPTPLGEHDLELILKLLKRLKVKAKIIINRSDIGKCQAIRKLSGKHSAEIISEIPYSKKMLESYSRGKPIEIESIKDIAGSL